MVGRDDIAGQKTVVFERLPAGRLSHFVRIRLPRNKASMLPSHQIDVLTGGFDTRLPFLPAWLGRIDGLAFLGSAARRHGQIDDRNEDQWRYFCSRRLRSRNENARTRIRSCERPPHSFPLCDRQAHSTPQVTALDFEEGNNQRASLTDQGR